MKINVKTLSLLFLLAFASTSTLTIVLSSAVATPSINSSSTASFPTIQPTGGEEIDNPLAPCIR